MFISKPKDKKNGLRLTDPTLQLQSPPSSGSQGDPDCRPSQGRQVRPGKAEEDAQEPGGSVAESQGVL